jgi:prepilin-type N-terminal cleavage/methylation domain-containing protein
MKHDTFKTKPQKEPRNKVHDSCSMFHGRRGFTLVEMLVALTLFVTTISIAIGGFVTALRTQRQIASLIAANNNLSLTLEQMAREIRTGYSFCRSGMSCYDSASSACGHPGTPIASNELNFVNSATQLITYRLEGGAIKRDIGSSFGGSVTTETITSDNVTVRRLDFTMCGYAPADGWPPRITISVGVSSNDPAFQDTIINLQTTVSARQIDS